jgi:hypothetical protein
MIELIDVLKGRFRFTVHQRPGHLLQRARARTRRPRLRPPAVFPLPRSLRYVRLAGFVGVSNGSDGSSDDGPSGGGKSSGGASGDGASGGENADGGPRTDDVPRTVECMLSDVQGLCLVNEDTSSSFKRQTGPPIDGPSPPSPQRWRACMR